MLDIKEKPEQGPRKANDFLNNEGLEREPALLFDAVWREGELAMLFGPSGAGKSVLAVQIADAIARGRPIGRFRMPTARRRVLYVDLELSSGQFGRRYSYRHGSGKPWRAHKFSENLFRVSPPESADLCEWLRGMISECVPQVVVIDSLTVMKQTNDGTRETLALLKALKRLRDELCISMLVLMATAGPGRRKFTGEADLGRSQILCGVADTVFAIGTGPRKGNDALLIQTRSRNAPIEWTLDNAPVCSISRLESGLLGFVFDHRFSPKLDEPRRQLICRIRNLRDHGLTFDKIAAALKTSPATACRLNKKWTRCMERPEDEHQLRVDEIFFVPERPADSSPQLPSEIRLPALSGPEADEDKKEEWELAGIERPFWLDLESDAAHASPLPDNADAASIEPQSEPWETATKRRTIYDLERVLDNHGREIFIAKRCPSSGKIQVFYKLDDNGLLKKWKKIPNGWKLDPVKDPPYLDSG